ncbi:TniQ family protein [Ktedonobacter robiniae]|uniref:TniQ family protein n=1 Tax=Ktedonobacter robiniae TaxID=2778365 RepID=UPI00191519DA|nr:TniQ family protein [Ktedonobacter robiniae]
MTLHRFSAPFKHLEYFPVIKVPSWRSGLTEYLKPKIALHHDPIERPRLQRDLHRTFFLPNQTTQICPLCLQEEVAYDRLYWKARYLLTCHKHRLLLLRHCPHCSRRIPSQRLDPTSCPYCRHSYASTVTLRIAPEAMGLVSGDQLTLRALGVLPPLDHPSIPLELNDPRTLLPPQQYIALLRAFCISLHRLQPADVQSLLPNAFTAFLHTNQLFQRPYPDAVPHSKSPSRTGSLAPGPTISSPFSMSSHVGLGKQKKKHAFDNFPHHFLLGDLAKDALAIVSHAYQQYQPTYSLQTLEHRIQEHLDACNTASSSSP